ncbi:MAG: Ig-like domain-containing protein [Clostridiales bacterium]|nr:Ig-like domain-containing protein [Clostridiales bacterium]
MSSQAASKITLKSGAAAPSTVYAGRSYTLAVKGQAVKFYSSNKTVATIGMTTGKFKPVNPGTVKITAKSKKTGKTVATKTFTVLKRARSVSVDSESEICLLKGDVLALKATVEPANSTDVIRFYSSDKEFHDFAFDGFCKICSCKKPSSSSDPSSESSPGPTEEPSPGPSPGPTEEPSPDPDQDSNQDAAETTASSSPEPSSAPTEDSSSVPSLEPSPEPNQDAVLAESTAFIIKGAKAMASIDKIAIHVSVLSQL